MENIIKKTNKIYYFNYINYIFLILNKIKKYIYLCETDEVIYNFMGIFKQFHVSLFILGHSSHHKREEGSGKQRGAEQEEDESRKILFQNDSVFYLSF